MSEYDDYDDETDAEDSQRGDSTAVRELRKANRSKEKQIKDLMEQLSSVQKSVRERSVKDVLAARGLNEKISAFIPAEFTSTEEVSAWVEEYGDVFGIQASASENENSNAPDLSGLNRIAATQQSGQPFQNDPDQIAGLIAAARTTEDLNKILFGNTTGPSAV